MDSNVTMALVAVLAQDYHLLELSAHATGKMFAFSFAN